MPLPGPTAAKVGIRYEDAWTAHCALKVLEGDAEAIHLEEPGTEDRGFEFSLVVGEATEHHQVKRQRAGEGGWSLSSLASSGVLPAFRAQLTSPGSVCVFASGNAAQTLDDLATDALKSESWSAFYRTVLSYDTRMGHFRQLRDIWQADDQWTFEALRRLRIECTGERQLNYVLRLQTQILLEGPVDTTPDALIAVLRKRVNERVDAATLWAELEQKGFRRNPWQSSGELFARVRAVNDGFQKSRTSTLIRDQLISRPEVADIRAALSEQQIVLVEGTAGAGKSDVLYELTTELDNDAVRYLIFRLDRWESTASPEALAAQMNLPVSPPAALAALSPQAPCVLVIDQLDAMSSTSGRNTEFFECVDEMLRLSMTRPDMSVVLACRHFDARNDARLRRLLRGDRHTVSIGPLSDEQVGETLSLMAVEQKLVTPQLRELLRVPLHLALLDQILPVDAVKLPAITTLRGLYDEFWKSKQVELARQLGREPNWIAVLDELVEDMHARASLQAPIELVDRWEADRAAMLSASVLLEDKGQLAFFHETFFDYVFARRYFARRRTVRDLLAADQLLFRRAQVRQLLAYERQGATDRYIEDLRYLLFDPAVRFHIRDLVMAWLATVDDPTQAEWDVLAELMDTAEGPIVSRVRGTITRPAWFVFLAGLGVIERWLADDSTADLALEIISAGQSGSPDLAASLLERYRHRSPPAASDVAAILHPSSLAGSRKAFQMVIDLLDDDDPSLSRRDFFYLAHDLEKEHPERGCELIAAYLRNRLRAAEAADVRNPFEFHEAIVPRQLAIHDLVNGSALGAPQAFVQHVLPQMLAVIERTALPESADETEPVPDEVWHGADSGDRSNGLDDDLLSGMTVAMRELAARDQERFLGLVAEHRNTNYETVCGLLFEGFRADPKNLGDIAADFVLVDLRRLSVGRSSDDHWASRQLLQAIAPHCSRQHFERLETSVLDHFTPWERSPSGRQARGYSQFTLLEGLPQALLGDLSRRRLGEWQRKFGTQQPHPPRGVTGGVVGSPIPSHATRKMKDAHWLQAFERYSSTDSDSRDFLKGGAQQLAHELEARATEDPVRFATLACDIPNDVHPYYFDALLRGVGASEHDVTVEATRALIVRCHALPGRPCGRWIAQPLRRHRHAPLPSDLVEILAWYAECDPHPPAISSDFSGDIPDAQRIEMQGLNSVRGSIANEIATHIGRHEENVAPFMPAVEVLVRDPSAPVRGMAVRTLTGLMRHRAQLAVELFVELASHPEDLILAGREAHEFLRYAGARHFGTVRPVIERMLRSDKADVRTRGAVQAALAALDESAAHPLVEKCLSGDSSLRIGVAQVAAANARSGPRREYCGAQLIALFQDRHPGVREAATDVFRRLADDDFADSDDLVDAFIASPAFDARGAGALLSALDLADAPPAPTSLRACRAYLESSSDRDDADTRSMALHDAGELAVRAYADADDRYGQNAALDVIDRVLERDAFRINRALAEYER